MLRKTVFSISALAVLTLGCPPTSSTGGGGGGGGTGGNVNLNSGGGNANGNANSGGGARMFTATLTAAAETPASSSTGTGMGTFTLNDAQTQLTFSVTATGLTGEVILAHFHRGAVGVAGPIVFNIFDQVRSSGGQVTADGIWPLTEQDRDDLLNGLIYVNFHTAMFPAGEIRGQLVDSSR